MAENPFHPPLVEAVTDAEAQRRPLRLSILAAILILLGLASLAWSGWQMYSQGGLVIDVGSLLLVVLGIGLFRRWRWAYQVLWGFNFVFLIMGLLVAVVAPLTNGDLHVRLGDGIEVVGWSAVPIYAIPIAGMLAIHLVLRSAPASAWFGFAPRRGWL